MKPAPDAGAPANLLVGCAGWSVPKESAAQFPAGGSHLERYAARLNAVEINSSFYRPHRAATYARWADTVPEHFRFAVKLPRAITHEARLAEPQGPLAGFAGQAGALGEKLGCVLVQLPPSLHFDADRAGTFIDQLRPLFSCMIALEARHASWFGEAATRLLHDNAVTRVLADPPAGQPGPHEPTTPDSYLRLHGHPIVYYSDYDQAYIDGVANKMREIRGEHSGWCIFDNTAAGRAVPNAIELTTTILSRIATK